MAARVGKQDDKSAIHSSFYVQMAAGVAKEDSKRFIHSSFYM